MKKVCATIIFSLLVLTTYSQVNHPESGFVIKQLEEIQVSKASVFVTDYYVSKGITHIYFKDAIHDIPVYNSRGSMHYKSKDKVIVNNQLMREVSDYKLGKTPRISADDIIKNIARSLAFDNVMTTIISAPEGPQRIQTIKAEQFALNSINANLQYYIAGKNDIKLIWEIPIENARTGLYVNYLVDANTGEIVEEISWTDECNFGSCTSKCSHENGHVLDENFSSTAMANTYNVFNWPVESPNFGSRSLVTEPWLLNSTASPAGWHNISGTNYTTSRGNNTDAYLDDDNTNSPTGGDDDRAFGGATLDFDFPLDVSGDPEDYRDAAITNTFYWVNVMHDVWYNYGFDEASGNFQGENYTAFGNSNDYVLSEVQDGSGTCNANFSTPPDGGFPRMQMYLCNGRDGDYDNGVIAHEFGHGISNRLTGGPSASGCLSNQEQMGEGWSDYFGIVMTIEPGDLATDSRSVGTWLFGQGPNGGGIRPFPYSTDMSVNPMTYNSIKTVSVPHGVGSVWSTMLWDLTWAMIDEYGWDADIYNGTGGNNMSMLLVMEGLKLQPCSPGFVDGRDAILQADSLLYGGANHCLIWEVFANRGLGFSASQGSSSDRSDGTESFDMPPSCALKIEKSTTAVELFPGEQLTYEIITSNNFPSLNLTDIVISDTIPFQTNFISATSGGVYDGTKVSFPPRDLDTLESDTVYITLEVKNNLTYIVSDFYDDMESGTSDWNPTATGSTSWGQATDESSSGTTSWFSQDAGSPGIANLDFSGAIGIGDEALLTFTHKFDTEVQWDGGLVLISTDNGGSWTDLGPYFTVNGYNNTLYNSIPGFSGDSGGFISSSVDLSAFENSNVIIRFQMNCDQAVAGVGWWIDDVILSDTKNILTNRAIAYSDTMTSVDDANFVVLLPDPSTFQVSTDIENISCFGENDGTIELIAQGGSGNYTYLWNDNNTNASRTDLVPGLYSVTISDGASNIMKYVTMVEPIDIELAVSSTPVLSIGGSDGSATAIASGGTGNISYLWSTGSDSSAIVNKPGGVYTVVVTDENGCNKSETVTIEDPFSCTEQLLRMDIQLDQYPEEFSYVLSHENGQIVAQEGPFNNVPDGYSFTEFFCVIDGCYELSVTDSYGDGICASYSFPQGFVQLQDAFAGQLLWSTCDYGSGANFEFCLPGTSNMIVNKAHEDVSCDGLTGGSIDVSDVEGNYGTLSYAWSNGSTEAIIGNLPAGEYIVTITDHITSIFDTTQILPAGNSIVRQTVDGAPESLRDILMNGCTTDTISFDADLFGDTLLVNQGEIPIVGNKVILGLGATNLVLNAENSNRIFNVDASSSMHIQDIQLINGEAIENGGAILNNGTTILERTIFKGNTQNGVPKTMSNTIGATLLLRDENDMNE